MKINHYIGCYRSEAEAEASPSTHHTHLNFIYFCDAITRSETRMGRWFGILNLIENLR
ncbi:hypothetical protein G7B40_031005 [Aetokthonos hydrillicola Thurmond2011]|uniref:Uncharacterized protein n=1 Tax=Aetokthonos hydrillicola Thurmond2011 TaxID=2712845 RepID=A0AAP5MD84_9CYAN|nr:hypothetical protein [Aetokthonos hydrillicola]MBO3462105.1 hypothetical protein [Aetokthonos hydrillicola CCALA 1050]MBW4589700.1 hypothetical protein [Aetokthonos hydrillicola CCALA 1050]MDR9898954.1 hypothetical protein [Aetokthonos hydrillicola Thurmond2011]